MKIYKNKNQLIAVLTGLSLSALLTGCMPAKNNSVTINTQTTENTINQKDQTNEKVEEKDTIVKEDADTFTKDYINSLKEDYKELKKYTKDKWNSKEVKEKRDKIKQKVKMLIDFIFNGGEIKGYTYNDLSDKGKENVKKSISEIDEIIEDYIPSYKERFHSWLVDKGADSVETWHKLKDKFNDYKNEVLEEYNGRTK